MLYLFRKAMRIPLRKIRSKREGCLISLIGVNGSGKTTLARKTLEAYQPITQHLGKQQYYCYFGWKPEFPLTKLLSAINQKMKITSFKDINISNKDINIQDKDINIQNKDINIQNKDINILNKDTHIPNKDINISNNNINVPKTGTSRLRLFRQELIFIYSWLEFLYRYYKNIYPKLRQGHLVVTDRYFYDIYGQNIHSKKSLVLRLLMGLFPKPSYTIILDTDIPTLLKREKTDKNELDGVTETKRQHFPAAYLQTQRENYFFLAERYGFPILDTNNNIEDCTGKIISNTWRKLL